VYPQVVENRWEDGRCRQRVFATLGRLDTLLASGELDSLVRFPVVGEQTLRDLVKEWKATGPTYRVTPRSVIRNSYRGTTAAWCPSCWPPWSFVPITTVTAW
jgi:hypothetical protein